MKRLKIIAAVLSIPLLLLVSGLTAWWWLTNTGSGARWLLDQVPGAVAGDMSATVVTGDLSSGLRLKDVRFENQAVRLELDVLQVSVRARLLPAALDVTTLHADGVGVWIKPQDTKPVDAGNTADDFSVPLPLAFRDIRISGIRVIASPGAEALVIQRVEAAGALSSSLALQRLYLALEEDEIELSGQADLAYPYTMAITFDSRGRWPLAGNLRGDVESAELELDVASPAAHLEGSVAQLLQNPTWDLAINAPSFAVPLGSEDNTVRLAELVAESTGAWPHFELNLTAILDSPWMEPSRMTLSGNGTDRGFTVGNLALDGPEASMEATGNVSWADAVRLEMSAQIVRLHPGRWLPEWPDNHPVSGKVELEWSGERLAIDHFSLAAGNTGLQAFGSGIFDPQGESVDLDLAWQNFSWPIDSPDRFAASEQGNVRISGNPDNWILDGDFDLVSGDFPRGRLLLTGSGNRESLNVDLQEGKVLGGTIAGSLFWQWTGSQPFRAELSARQIRTAPLFPEFPGVLTTRFDAEGKISPLEMAVDIHQLDGTVLDHTFTGRGGFHVEKGRVFADSLFLGSGPSSLTLDGSLYDPDGIRFSADIDSLERFAGNLGGSLVAEGRVSLDPAAPRVSVSLSGADFTLGQVSIQQLETRRFPGPDTGEITELKLTGLQIGQRPVESMSIRFDGDKPLQWAAVSAQMKGTALQFELRGAVNDWNDPLSSGWSGELSRFALDHQGRFELSLNQPAGLEWSPNAFALEPACLSGTRGASLCASAGWQSAGDLELSADLEALPVGLIDLAIQTDLRFTQRITGALTWSQAAATGRKALAQFRITPGIVRAAEDDEVLLETGEGLFGFKLAGGQVREGTFDLGIPDVGEVDIDFNVPELDMGPDSLIDGNVKVDFRDLSTLERTVPLLDSIDGRLDIDLALGGTVNDPAFNGTVSIRDGAFSNQASGFSFTDINVSGAIRDTDRAEITGAFRSGEGAGDIKAAIQFQNPLSPVIELSLRGQSLTLIDVPDLVVVADPDIQLGWRNRTLDVNGRLFIPRARLSPSYLPQASARQSEDVVIVAGEAPETEQDFLKEHPVKVRGTLEVELGNNAQIDLDIARVNVFGSTRFTWRDELLPVANGNFDLRGEIQAYGQLLKVTQGRIGFPDIPADNPHLNIRAERDIYGNTQIQKAGLMVAGTLKRPVTEAYTVPATNKDRAQTLLVTGSDFDYEQGVGAVAVGTYVLPKLYVSYGIGVFEEGNVISARYDLGRRFGVKVTSGQKDTGVDLNYTLER